MKTTSKIVASLLLGAVLVGCGSSNNSTPPADTPSSTDNNETTQQESTAKLTGGKVSDAYISKSNILIDLNGSNGSFDKGDYNTTTDLSGNFAIDDNVSIPKGTFLYAKGGINVSTGEEFNGTLKGVFNGDTESMVLTPLTTMVAVKVENGEEQDSAKEKVATALGIDVKDVDDDPVVNNNTLKATQKVIAVAKVLKVDDNSSDISDIIEKIAENIDDDLSKAIEKSASNKDTAEAAKDTVEAVEEAIKSLTENNVTDNIAIENIISTQLISSAVEAVSSDSNVTEALEEAKTAIEDTTTADIAKVVECLSFETIKGENSFADNVEKALDLNNKSICEENGVVISWIKSTPAVVDLVTGDINQSSYDTLDVILEANVTKNGRFTIDPILFVVPSKGHKPIAMPDMVTTTEDTPITIDVLANDQDLDGLDELTIEIVSNPAHGEVEIKDGKIIYTPESDYFGDDSFEYKLIDPLGAEVVAKVDIKVTAINDIPEIEPIEAITIDEDSPSSTITLTALDNDGDSLTFSATSSDPAKLKVEVQDNVLTYTPEPNAFGNVDIIVKVTDGKGGEDILTIPVVINPVNDAPKLEPITIPEIDEDSPSSTITLSAIDVDGDSLTFSASSSNSDILEVSVDGDKLTYTPKTNMSGVVEVTISVTDSSGETDTITVPVTINAVNDAPEIADITIPAIDEDSGASSVTVTATDVEGDSLTYSAVSSDPAKLKVEMQDNVLTYTPEPNAFGDVNVTITVTDSNGASSSKVVPVVINPVNDAPVAVDDILSINNNVATIIDALANDSDVDGDSLTIVNVETPSSGEAVIEDGKIKYTPSLDFNGSVEFGYTISDGNLTSTAKIKLDILAYVSKMTQAIETAENYDLENNDLETLLSNLETILNSAPEDEKDAKVGLALISVIDTLNTQMDNVLSVNGDSSGVLRKLLTAEDVSVALADTIDDLASQTEESTSALASKLVELSQELDTLFADDSYVFKYKDFELNSNDASAISAGLLLEAGKLEFLSAYNIAKKEYIETKTVEVDGVTYEYQVIKADPVTVFNDTSTLSLNTNAQSHFDKAKENLLNAFTKLENFDSSKSNLDFKDNIDENKADITAIKTSLNGGADYVIEDSKGRKNYVKISALFDTSTALTLSNTLGNNWVYDKSDCNSVEYNATLSQLNNKAMGNCPTIDLAEGSYTPSCSLDVEPQSIPTANNVIPQVITKVELEDNTTYTGEDILKVLFGEFDIVQDTETYSYSNPADINISFSIIDGPAGSTAPYSCRIDYSEYDSWDDNSDDMEDILEASMVDNKCIVKLKEGVELTEGYVWFRLIVEDNYGNDEDYHSSFSIEYNSDSGDDGDEGDGDSSSSDSSDLTFEFGISEDDFENAIVQSFSEGTYYKVEYEYGDDELELNKYTVSTDTVEYVEYINNEERESATVPYSVNNNVIEVDYNDEHDETDLYLKFISTLDYEDLNKRFNDLVGEEANIFESGDEGYVLYEKEIAEDDSSIWEFEGKVWLNESAKDKLIQYIDDNLRNN